MAHRGATIREKSWVELPAASSSVSASGTFIVSGILDFIGPGTLLRFRCNDILITMDATKQAADTIRLTFGLGIVSTDAAAAGAASMPDPLSDTDYPWIWYGDYIVRSEVAAATEALGSSVIRFSADSKAMRRVKPLQSLLWVMQASGAAGVPTTLVDVGTTRVLLGN